jgi:hypothetical protein
MCSKYEDEIQSKYNDINTSFDNVKIQPIIKSPKYNNYRNDITYNRVKSDKFINNSIGSFLSICIYNFMIQNYKNWNSIRIRESNKHEVMIIINSKYRRYNWINYLFMEPIQMILSEYNKKISSIWFNNNLICGKKYIKDYYYTGNVYISLNSFRQINHKTAITSYNVLYTICKRSKKKNLTLIAGDISAILVNIHMLFKHINCMTNDANIYFDFVKTINSNNIRCRHSLINYEAIDITNEIRPGLIILNPGRSGMKNNILMQLNHISNIYSQNDQHNIIIYISCCIKSAKKDINLLTSYRIYTIIPIDHLPQTDFICMMIVLFKI